MKHLFYLLFVLFLVTSCGPTEGVGGKNSIKGYIFTKEYTINTGVLKYIYPSREHNVYIVYGDNNYYDNNIKTDYKGGFEFNYLFNGKYKVFVYSECITCPGNEETIIREVEVSKGSKEFELDTIFIKKFD